MSDKDNIREERIYMEAIVDAHDYEERALGWYYYLEDKIMFPFTAECSSVDKRSPLEPGEHVKVLQMSGESLCEHDMYVDIIWNGRSLAIPLAQVLPVNADDDTDEAVRDWHYWKAQGYLF
jgi:hypothetical protein